MKSKGFTIIELLVVVAIIAVLTGIVLVNVTQYINRGKDSSVQGNLSSILVNAAIFYDNPALGNGTYTGLCGNATITVPLAAANKAYNGDVTPVVTDCNSTATAWAACGQLKVTDAFFCVDSLGTKKIIAGRGTCVVGWLNTAC